LLTTISTVHDISIHAIALSISQPWMGTGTAGDKISVVMNIWKQHRWTARAYCPVALHRPEGA
jgi:hypothetical protein